MVQFLIRGGLTMIPILLCSIISVAVIIERGISLRRRRVLPDRLRHFLEGPELSPPPPPDPSPLGELLNCGFLHREEAREQTEEAMQVKIKQIANRLEGGLVILEIVAVISPLLGLLGTVIGMVQVFNVITQIGVGHAQALSAGISQALISTIAGLVVAIPALVAYNIYIRVVDALLLELEEASALFLKRLYPAYSSNLMSKPDKRHYKFATEGS